MYMLTDTEPSAKREAFFYRSIP